MEYLYKKFIKNHKDIKNPLVVKKYGLLAGVIGIILNFILFICKILIALITSSISIIGDAFNNLSDASSSVITLIGFKMSSKPADKEHPYGHQRIEYIVTFIISFLILFIGAELAISGVKKIISPTAIEFNYVIISILLLTVIIKLWMGIFYYKTSKKINSLSLKASSRDSFNDVITTFVIIVGLLIGNLFSINIDGYLAIVVSIYILVGGIVLVKETINKLIGGTPDNELIEKVKKEILNEKEIIGVHDVLYHYYGLNQAYMSLHVEVDGTMSLVMAHKLVDSLEKKIKNSLGVELVIHVDPILLDDAILKEVGDKLLNIIKNIDEQLSYHDLSIENNKGKSIISFDLQLPYEFKLSSDDVYNIINKEIKKINGNYRVSINFDRI